MTNILPKIEEHIGKVSRRRFLSGTAGAIATTGVALLPQQTSAKPISLEQTSQALHEIVVRYSEQNAPIVLGRVPSVVSTTLGFTLENMRYCSVAEIQQLLKPLLRGAS